MNIFKNIKNYLILSAISFLLSILLLNFFSQIFSLEFSVKLVIICLFIYNFIRLKSFYSFNNSSYFFIFYLLLIIFSRIIEYKVFFLLFNILNEKNISWFITLSASFVIKFLYLEILYRLRI